MEHKPTITARGILMETIMEKPDVFKNPATWVSVVDLRDHIMHPYDIERLQLSYPNNSEAWQAIIAALDTFPFIEVNGNGMNTEFRVKHFPNTLPRTLNDALAEVKQLRSVLGKWKDVGQQMIDLTEGTHSLNLAMKENEAILHKTAALAFYYRSRIIEFCKARDLEMESIDPDPMLLEAIMVDPSKFAEVKVLTSAFGILTDEALEKSVENASN